MAREIQITPRRISYAQAREAELYASLMNIASEKQEEITRLIQVTVQDMKNNIADVVLDYRQGMKLCILVSNVAKYAFYKCLKSHEFVHFIF